MNSKRKGTEFERHVVNLIKLCCPQEKVTRNFQFRKGHNAPDVSAGRLWIECKAGRRVRVAKVWKATALAAFKANAERAFPCVAHKGPRGEVLITMSLDDLLQLSEEGATCPF